MATAITKMQETEDDECKRAALEGSLRMPATNLPHCCTHLTLPDPRVTIIGRTVEDTKTEKRPRHEKCSTSATEGSSSTGKTVAPQQIKRLESSSALQLRRRPGGGARCARIEGGGVSGSAE